MRTGKLGPWEAVVRCWKAHPRIAQFITYFMVGNLATVVQLVLIPVLQPILGGTSLVVYPAAGLLRYFRGRHLVVINMQPTPADESADLCIAQPIGQVLREDVELEEKR